MWPAHESIVIIHISNLAYFFYTINSIVILSNDADFLFYLILLFPSLLGISSYFM